MSAGQFDFASDYLNQMLMEERSQKGDLSVESLDQPQARGSPVSEGSIQKMPGNEPAPSVVNQYWQRALNFVKSLLIKKTAVMETGDEAKALRDVRQKLAFFEMNHAHSAVKHADIPSQFSQARFICNWCYTALIAANQISAARMIQGVIQQLEKEQDATIVSTEVERKTFKPDVGKH